jgi:hypothetical protein
MTVRTWITISVLVLIALSAAFVTQLTRTIEPPPIIVQTKGERLDGALDDACWPQRNGKLRCTTGDEHPVPQTIDGNGSFRIVLASPAQPQEGSLRITDDDGDTIVKSGWKRTLRYDLEPGAYSFTAQAGESGRNNAFVRYVFALRVTRSGS